LERRGVLFAEAEARLDGGAAGPAWLRNVRSIPVFRQRWETLALDEQRAVLQTEIAFITTASAATRGSRFDASRVQISWISDALAEQPDSHQPVSKNPGQFQIDLTGCYWSVNQPTGSCRNRTSVPGSSGFR
jgi:phage terminase large subunit-like protein